MRCFFIFAFSLFVCYHLSAQAVKKGDEDFDKVFTKIEINAVTDNKAWAAYLKKSAVLTESESANIPAGIYKITVLFIVDTYGNLGEVKAKNNPGYGLAKKSEKIISNYEGIWKPAVQCGRVSSMPPSPLCNTARSLATPLKR